MLGEILKSSVYLYYCILDFCPIDLKINRGLIYLRYYPETKLSLKFQSIYN